MEPAVIGALIAGSVAAVGWLTNHVLARRRDESQRKSEALLGYVERQLEELYGPLAFLIYESRQSFRDLLDSLGRPHVFVDGQPLPEDELRTWLFWTEMVFLPRNEKIQDLLRSNTHLIEGNEFPPSHVAFLNHHNSWMINHRRWKTESVAYSWRSAVNWPAEFDVDILATFSALKRKHAQLLGEVMGRNV